MWSELTSSVERGCVVMRTNGRCGKKKYTRVTAVTERAFDLGDTPVVNMVRKASKKALLEPGDTR